MHCIACLFRSVMIKAHHYIHSECHAKAFAKMTDYIYISRKRLNTDRLSVQYVTLPVWNPDYTLMTDTRCATACFDAAGIALRVQDLTPVAYPCKQLYKSMPCREIHPACPSKRTDGCTVSISAGSMVKLPICFPKADTTLT